MTARRPASLVYAVDDRPPVWFSILSGLQHVSLNTMWLAYPLLVVRESGAPVATAVSFVSMCLIMLGVGTALQAIPRGPLGSGFLAPGGFSGIYIGPALIAVKLGGLPLFFGMTIFAGAVEALLSRALYRLRPYLPPEVAGLVVLFIGLVVGAVGLRYVLGIGSSEPLSTAHYVTTLAAGGTMLGLNVWGKGLPRLFCVLVGVVVGYLAAFATGLLGVDELAASVDRPIVALPNLGYVSWAFDLTLVLPFALAGLAAALSTTASITIFQKMHDADWKRADMRSVRRGVLADGCNTMLAGAFGTYGQVPSTSNVGLIAATGVASRSIAWATAAILVALGLLPPVAYFFSIMPEAVMGPALMFSAAFILVGGMQIITARLIDARRTFVISGSTLACLTPLFFPGIGAGTPLLGALVGSPLALGTLVALALNLLFRIGVHKTASFQLASTDRDLHAIEDRMREQGAAWGARPEVIARAAFAVQQFVEATVDNYWSTGPLEVATTFDEFNLDVRLTYTGAALEFPDVRPTREDIMASDDGARKLAGYMLRRNADRASSSASHGRAVIDFRFDH
jgi:xanthine permease XanP